MNVLNHLQQIFARALVGLTNDPDKYASLVKPVGDPKHGDYQANLAMSLAKELGKPPKEVAAEVIKRLDADDVLETPEVSGPGFINLRIKTTWLAEQIRLIAADDRLGVAETTKSRTFVIDYSSPNVAKPLHVGHLRSTIIGDSLKRLLQFLGHRVIADNHLGDWGTQFGMLIHGYKQYRDDAALKADPVREMVRIYQLVRGQTKPADKDDDPNEDRVKYTPEQIEVAKRVLAICREETQKLQAGDQENVTLWQQFMPWSMGAITPLYDRLGVTFDHMHGESFYNPMLTNVVDELVNKGIATISQGAAVIFLTPPPEDGSEHQAAAVVRKSDNAFTYMASDLATIQYRMKEFQPDVVLYVVGTPQSKHFQTLFEVAERWVGNDIELRHVNFGSVLGNDRKMLSTRNGGAAELSELLEMAVAKADKQYQDAAAERATRDDDVPELSAAQRKQIGERVGIGAVKYADLSQHRTTDYMFSWDKMLAMDGNTATYMQYAYARCRSIFRKGGEDPVAIRNSAAAPDLADPYERTLALKLLQFEEILHAAAAEYVPHYITTYLWDLAKTYSGFFTNCPVLKAPTAESRRSRLLLCDLTGRTIQRALGLLGIDVVEQM